MTTKLGITYTDKISRFRGVATGRVEYITGCNQALLAPEAKDGAYKEPVWFDESRLEEDKGVPAIEISRGENPGFDIPAPIR